MGGKNDDLGEHPHPQSKTYMKDLQKRVSEFVEKYNLEHSPEVTALDLVSEIGEVAKEILESGDYGKKKLAPTDEMKKELGDALHSLITLANTLNIDLEEALQTVLKKYENRLQEKGTVGSGRE